MRERLQVKNIKAPKVLMAIFIVMFISGILIGMLGRLLCINDNKNYEKTLPEINTVEEINTVLIPPDNNYIYVCYNDGSYVNVYNENGEFIWAVSVPYLRNSYFEIKDGHLVVYNGDEAYLYNKNNGNFIAKKSSEDLELAFVWENTGVNISDFKIGEVYFNTYNVFRITSDGTKDYIVKKPVWYNIFYFPYDWLFGFIGAVSILIMSLISITRQYIKSKSEKTSKKSRYNKKVNIIITYSKITIALSLIFFVLNLISGAFWDGGLCIGIMPLAIHFIISNIIISIIRDRISVSRKEESTVGFWTTWNVASFILAFFSVIIVAFLSGN